MPFVLTKGDSTLFDASFILEEDIIDICNQFGHTSSLWYSTIKLVMLFHITDELQITMCGVVKAMTLCDGAIRVRTSQPSTTYVRAYMTAVTGEPSSIQPSPSDGEDEPHTSPSNPHTGGRTLQHLQANLEDLADNELQQLMEEHCREITL